MDFLLFGGIFQLVAFLGLVVAGALYYRYFTAPIFCYRCFTRLDEVFWGKSPDGWVCPTCGCWVDSSGKVIEEPASPRRRVPCRGTNVRASLSSLEEPFAKGTALNECRLAAAVPNRKSDTELERA